jgi:hypothetical protein
MKFLLALLAASCLSLLSGLNAAANAQEDIALSFDLPPMETPQEEAAAAPPEAAPTPDLDPADQPLPIPPGASSPPVRYHAASQLPSGVYRRGVAVALNQGATAASLLPPAPPMLYTRPIAVAPAPDPEPEPAPEPATPDPVVEIALGFNAFEPKPDPAARPPGDDRQPHATVV